MSYPEYKPLVIRNSAIADKPRDAFRDIKLRKIQIPLEQGLGH